MIKNCHSRIKLNNLQGITWNYFVILVILHKSLPIHLFIIAYIIFLTSPKQKITLIYIFIYIWAFILILKVNECGSSGSRDTYKQTSLQ